MPSTSPKKVRGLGVSRGPSTEGAVPGLHPNRASLFQLCAIFPDHAPLLHGLTMEGEVEAFLLDVAGHAQADDDVDDLEDDQRHDHVVADHDGDAVDLVEHLARVAFEQA